jgi:anti-anti-sigma factor
MTLSVGTGRDEPSASGTVFEVRTARCDAMRASLRIGGDVDDEAAAVLAHVIEGHLRSGRRFLRVNVASVRTLSSAAVAVIAAAHEQLLGRRGTMILTGVSDPLANVLRAATPASPLFLLAPTAAEPLT